MSIEAVKKEIAKTVSDYIRTDGCLPEADEDINSKQRELVHLYVEKYGQAWLAMQWAYTPEEKAAPILWQYDGGIIYTFGSSYVLPCYDEEFVTLVAESRRTPFQQVKPVLDRIFNRLRAVGGDHLIWT